MLVTKNCEKCGSEFKGKNIDRSRFCSRSCLYASQKKTETRPCLTCQLPITRRPYEFRGERVFCSTECWTKGQIGHPSFLPDPVETRVCEACGKEFEVGGRGRPHKSQRLCSIQCQKLGRVRSGTLCSELSVEVAAYLAGLIDGEGSIMLIERKRGESGAYLRVTIANTCLGVLEWAKQKTGIGMSFTQRVESRTHKASYSWRCHGDGAHSLLKQIRPYLIIKAEQADLAIEAHDRLRIPAFKADRAWQEEYRLRMKALNKRGPAKLHSEPTVL